MSKHRLTGFVFTTTLCPEGRTEIEEGVIGPAHAVDVRLPEPDVVELLDDDTQLTLLCRFAGGQSQLERAPVYAWENAGVPVRDGAMR